MFISDSSQTRRMPRFNDHPPGLHTPTSGPSRATIWIKKYGAATDLLLLFLGLLNFIILRLSCGVATKIRDKGDACR
jgi:hypothetical protein